MNVQPETIICDKCDISDLRSTLLSLIPQELDNFSEDNFEISIERISNIGIMVGFRELGSEKTEVFVGFDEGITVQELSDMIVDLTV